MDRAETGLGNGYAVRIDHRHHIQAHMVQRRFIIPVQPQDFLTFTHDHERIQPLPGMDPRIDHDLSAGRRISYPQAPDRSPVLTAPDAPQRRFPSVLG